MEAQTASLSHDELIREETGRIRLLAGLIEQPAEFLSAQNSLLYDRELPYTIPDSSMGGTGLPAATSDFYRRPDERSIITDLLPRVLNVGSGAEVSRKLAAINVDISMDGRPETVADVQKLPFVDGSFSVVRASHVLEHVPQDQILNTILEWKRVLHEDGELQIAVPDAEPTFQEIIDGQTPKGAPALSMTESTAPLAQIYGLGYENPETDERWRHNIIFSYNLLEHYLKEAGFTRIERRAKEEDLANACNVDDDSQNHYTLLVTAGREKAPHSVDEPLSEDVFLEKCNRFCQETAEVTPASYVIPVYNEEKNLKQFLASLEAASDEINAPREFIFVMNGCTDGTEDILMNFLSETNLKVKLVRSEKGIMTALRQGAEERDFDGFVGKLDADSTLHPHALDLMQMFMEENQRVGVTYSEPRPIDELTPYNAAEHEPPLRSRRLFFHGRTSLYRTDPFSELTDQKPPSDLRAEDYFFSFYYTYFKGLGSIARTPHAIVHGKTVSTFDDLATQITRADAEIDRVCTAYPPFKIVRKLLDREIFESAYKDTVREATGKAKEDANDWTRLESTK